MNNKCFLSWPRYHFAAPEAFKCCCCDFSQRHHIATPLALMEAADPHTVRPETVNRIQPKIEKKINNSCAQQQLH